MNSSDMYDKTASGKTEINDNASGLSMMERRVLILVNGQNDTATLAKLSLNQDIGGVIDRLLELGLIEVTGTASAASTPDAAETTAVDITEPTAPPKAAAAAVDDGQPGARELMCNTLVTFGNRVKIADLHNSIAEAGDVGTLKELVKPWYHAISETPGGMYQADDLRKEVMGLLEREEAEAA